MMADRPESMRAITFTRYGGPEVLTYSIVDCPAPTAHQLLIHVGASIKKEVKLLSKQRRKDEIMT